MDDLPTQRPAVKLREHAQKIIKLQKTGRVLASDLNRLLTGANYLASSIFRVFL